MTANDAADDGFAGEGDNVRRRQRVHPGRIGRRLPRRRAGPRGHRRRTRRRRGQRRRGRRLPHRRSRRRGGRPRERGRRQRLRARRPGERRARRRRGARRDRRRRRQRQRRRWRQRRRPCRGQRRGHGPRRGGATIACAERGTRSPEPTARTRSTAATARTTSTGGRRTTCCWAVAAPTGSRAAPGADIAAYSNTGRSVRASLDGRANDGVRRERDALRADIEGLRGGGERDTFIGNGAANILDGRGGRDLLVGRGGSDDLRGGTGADLLRARDGSADTVSCGSAVDRAFTDAIDRVLGNCERVNPRSRTRRRRGR